MDKYIRITKDCDARGAQVGSVYQVVSEKRDEYRCKFSDTEEYCFYVRKDCCEQVEAGSCSIPDWSENNTLAFDASKWSQSLRALEEATTGLDLEDIKKKSTWQVPENADFGWHLDKVAKSVTDLLKEKNAAYGNSALNPANIFSKLDAVESLLVRMDDKIMRIKNRGITDQTEDTISDLIGYLFLLKMALERKK